MENLEKYLKYYFLEDYLFDDVHKNFQKRGSLSPEEFFAIVIWKRNASKTKILSSIKKSGRTIREITSKVSRAKTQEQRLNALLFPKIPGIGIAFASAILTVCYPKDFTVADYRACASLKDFGEEVSSNPTINTSAYFEYLDKCKKLAHRYNLSLRDFDRILWAKDFYEGKNGLRHLVDGL
ncbi:MAG: hypothetical protein COX92_02190 [Candidatus Nealsonbacteria bacterium CG_4_10_14_0_2_um_filter_40_15]|uniref:Uncharacterized protein n=1 Tax=Candidatus Nealsonbacteria bacterium CG_4_10_14_0_2_um_filter_40_15 TaxID=1974682 RepID=A0A2M7UUA1_9BACT|nr:MAG: hypothetical protein COX92_02190 [Candidatus Nealsonbacteria bacterium CG_4_10_14_0_2_um_filter_40_15]